MKLTLLTSSAMTALCGLLSMTSLPAYAVGRLADITIVDRDTGRALPVHYSKGQYWVAGRPGARYAVSVVNRVGERVLAVPSVDGVNVLSGETAAWDQRGYVFSAYERYQITGWRKSNSEIAAFEFSSASSSYAGQTGRPANVGVIGVALFREQQPELPPPAYRTPQSRGSLSPESANRETLEPMGSHRDEARESDASSSVPSPAAAAKSRSSEVESQDRSESSVGLAKAAPSPDALRTPKLGTAHGQRETSVVLQTTFTRMQSQPNETISIRYDSLENLIAAGVIRAPARPLLPNAFPQSDTSSYVPDPPRS